MKNAKEYLFSKYPLVSPEWFDDNNLTQEMIKMMEKCSNESDLTDEDIGAKSMRDNQIPKICTK